jgi:hypothetical protein
VYLYLCVQAQEDLAETQRILDAAKSRLQEVEEGIATLQAKYDDSMRKKEELEHKCKECEARLHRADKVLNMFTLPTIIHCRLYSLNSMHGIMLSLFDPFMGLVKLVCR